MSVLLGYPLALCVVRSDRRTRALLLTLIMVPFWTSILVKSYAFVVVLGDQGLFNQLFRALGLPAMDMIFNRFGVLVGMANYLVPFVVLIVLGNLLGQSEQLRRAAAVMGATKGQIFWRITLPASLPAVIGAVLICFVLSMGAFVVPALLGGRRDFMLANLMDFYLRETLNWGAACGLAVLVIAINGLFVLALGRTPARLGGEL
jgi:ABC-type spermidine/putrescine transport system permease subunit I